jgi:hypothetical protein
MNIQNLKMKELMEIEELSGVEIGLWEGTQNVKLTLAIAYVIARKENPNLKWADVLEWDFEQATKWIGEEVSPKVTNS